MTRCFRGMRSVTSTTLLIVLTMAIIVTTASPRSSLAQGASKITVGATNGSADKTPLYVALQEGLFKKAGLEVEVQLLSGGNPAGFAALSNGSIDVLVAGALDYLQAISKKVVDAKMFGELVDSSTDVIVARDVTGVAQLKGRVVGVSAIGAGDQLYMRAILAKSGLSPQDVTFVVTGTPATRLAALAAGKIDATTQSDSNRGQAEKVGTVLLKSADSPIIVPNLMLGGTTPFVRAHKAQLQQLLRVLGDAVAWIRANPHQAVAACMKGSGADQATCATTIATNLDIVMSGKYTWSSSGAVNAEGIRASMSVLAQDDQAAARLTMDDVADMSIAAQP